MTNEEYRSLRKKVKLFFWEGNHLWRRVGPMQSRKVIGTETQQRKIIEAAHTYVGHKGRDATYGWIKEGYWWKNLYDSIAVHLRACEKCQIHDPQRPRELAVSTVPEGPMKKIHFDLQYMVASNGYEYLVEARCNLTSWVEVMPAKNKKAE
uniref:Integrase zinc-binding domain-containing protein n=1 Tax=Bionectria ochroleuca TaxID=29856 RepID=A0A8H7K1Q3_BIOOC